MSTALERATENITEQDLARMVLDREEIPTRFLGFQCGREGLLDNESMASQGFPGSTTDDVSATGRITGYLREFVAPIRLYVGEDHPDLIAATVVHLFRDRDEVALWIRENFLGEFQRFVGKDIGRDQQLIAVDRFYPDGFHDGSEGLRVLQTSCVGTVTSSIVDFRVGRLLGVAYLVTLGEKDQHGGAVELGLELEQRMVRVVLADT